MRIYRLENDHGHGPWSCPNSRKSDNLRSAKGELFARGEYIPSAAQDCGGGDDLERAVFGMADTSKYPFSKSLAKVGARSLEELREWFSPEDLQWYKETIDPTFSVREYEIHQSSKHVVSGRYQAVFFSPAASLVRTLDDAALNPHYTAERSAKEKSA